MGAFGPGPDARHRPRSYRPDVAHTQRVLDRIYTESRGRYGYLGDWHTHPLGRARPSSRDISSVRAIAAQPEVELPAPVVLIQATAPATRHVSLRELGAFRLDSKTHKVVRAELLLLASAPV
jgi:integrative and conjugative element protein (TIGR02256 family)